MNAATELAGFFAAHAVWCVCEGETLIPILAFQARDGKQLFRRMEAEQLEEAVSSGKQWLAMNPEDVAFAVLIYDAFVTLNSGRTDALIIEIRRFYPRDGRLQMALPYRHAQAQGGFAVHRPKFLGAEGIEQDFMELGDAFFRGVAQHEKGSALWDRHLDESV